MYMNGRLRPDEAIEKDWPSNELPKSAGFSGSLELGRYAVGNTWAAGSMLMDELLIWQEVLSCDDVLRLYHGYP